jgi:hypothetical protein
MKKHELYMGRITEVEIDRETESFVVVQGRRESKLSHWRSYHNTREAAIRHLLGGLEREVKAYKSRYEHAMKVLDEKRAQFPLQNVESRQPGP